jgi:hypothetical protein
MSLLTLTTHRGSSHPDQVHATLKHHAICPLFNSEATAWKNTSVSTGKHADVSVHCSRIWECSIQTKLFEQLVMEVVCQKERNTLVCSFDPIMGSHDELKGFEQGGPSKNNLLIACQVLWWAIHTWLEMLQLPTWVQRATRKVVKTG